MCSQYMPRPILTTVPAARKDGMEKSYAEIVRLLGKMGRTSEGFVFEGSRGYLPDGETPVESEAARDLVKKAMAMPEGELLYVVAIGAITNVASAILMEPEIVKKICVVWVGRSSAFRFDRPGIQSDAGCARRARGIGLRRSLYPRPVHGRGFAFARHGAGYERRHRRQKRAVRRAGGIVWRIF